MRAGKPRHLPRRSPLMCGAEYTSDVVVRLQPHSNRFGTLIPSLGASSSSLAALSSILFALCSPLHAQPSLTIDKTKNFILLVVPEADTVESQTATYRLSASTNPGNKVEVNGKPYKVYSSGAFCGKLDVNVGENIFVINSVSPSGDVATKTFVINRAKPIETTRADTLIIEEIVMSPTQDMWLDDGDILQVQFKGTPGCKASFTFGDTARFIAMKERPLANGRGIGGIYRGTYKVKAADTLLSQRIVFQLRDSSGNTVTKSTYAKVSFKPHLLPVVGITKGERPYLNTGLGEDRLGGHKFSIINPHIRLKITGKVNDMYRVALTKNQEAWIEDDYVDLQPMGTFFPSSLTGSMSVGSDGGADVVSLTVFDKLPYSTHQLLNPSRVIVDVYGATSNTNWITQKPTREIANVYHNQVEKEVFRITIELKHKQFWGHEIGYEGNTLKIKVRPQPERMKLKALTIALDAGHGGDNKGALGSTGALEKDVTFAIVKHLKQLFEDKGTKAILTRTDDSNVRMTDRFYTAYRGGADVLVSIHANSIGLTSDPAETKGAGTFYKHIGFRPLSKFILDEVLKSGLENLGNVGSFNFSLNGPTELPSALVETAFISNPEDEMKLLDDNFRKELAERIVDGIEEWLDWCDE
jgi:N-acetylmuramoyl-L-alanine amidase